MEQDFFPARYFLAIIFFAQNLSAGYYFLKSNIPPPPASKVKWSAPFNLAFDFYFVDIIRASGSRRRPYLPTTDISI